MTIQQNFEDRDKVKITVNVYGSGFYRRLGKRIFDVSLALVLLPFLLPIITILALFIKVDGGPAMFGHNALDRVGVYSSAGSCAVCVSTRILSWSVT